MKIVVFLINLVLIGASPFQWEEESPPKPKLDTHKKPVSPVQPTPTNPRPGKSSPAQPKSNNDPLNPFDNEFFNNSMSIHDMHQNMRQRQEALLKQFGNFFDDPFFRSPMGFGIPSKSSRGQGGVNQILPKNQNKTRNPWSPFSKSLPGIINSELQVFNKKGFIIVQKTINPKNNMDYQVNLKGRSVTVTSQTKQQNSETSQYSQSFAQSYSSSTQSVMLPQDVLSNFTQRIVGDKLVLIFQKK